MTVAAGAMAEAAVEPRRPPGVIHKAAADAGAMLYGAVRLLWRHWPVLLTLFLAAVAGRYWTMKAAVKVSDFNAVLGYLIVLFAPILFLLALVLALRAVRPSLPRLGQIGGQGQIGGHGRGGGSVLRYLASVLLPFLVVYEAFGLLKDDVSYYTYLVWEAETLGNPDILTPGAIDVDARLTHTLSLTIVGVIALALVLRFALRYWQGSWWPWSGLLAAYVEVVVLALAFTTARSQWGDAKDWIGTRRIGNWAATTWQDLVHRLDAFGPIGRSVADPLADLFGSLTAIIVLPLAWLTTGAVVYGRQLAAERGAEHAAPTELSQRWARLPTPLRWIGRLAGRDADSGLGPLRDGVRTLIRAGLVPTLLFCLAFVAANSATQWLWEIERLVIGPRDLFPVWKPLSETTLLAINSSISMALLVCLLAAGVDRVLRSGVATVAVTEPDEDQVGVSSRT